MVAAMNEPKHQSNSEILAMVARREITPVEAADALLEEADLDVEADGPWARLGTALMLAVLLILSAMLAVPSADGQAPRWTARDIQMETLACIHENDWVGGLGGTADCGAQIQVIENSRDGTESFTSALLRRMPHFAARTTSRSWVWDLRPNMIANPPGWPFPTPAIHYRDSLHSVFLRVQGFMRGEEALPCRQEPISWLGRRTDGHVIAERLDSGLWREADCDRGGPRTREAYLYQIDPD